MIPDRTQTHAAQFYERPAFLHRVVADFLVEGAKDGARLVMIARARTYEGVADHIPSHRVQLIDADATLPMMMDGDALNLASCDRLFDELITQVSPNGETVRLYGEMVDILCARGHHAAAVEIERRWNHQFHQRSSLSALCGYCIEGFDGAPGAGGLLEVCREHSHTYRLEAFEDLAVDGQFERAVLMQHRARTSTMFVVDDDASVRRSLARLLESMRFQVHTFESAEAFLAQADPTANGCLILDLQLLGMSGPELQGRLAAARWRLPVIAMSGSHDPQLEFEAVRLGATGFLPKPFEADALLEAIDLALP